MLTRVMFCICLFVVTAMMIIDSAELRDGDLEMHHLSQDLLDEINESDFTSTDNYKSRTKRGIFWDFFQKMVTTKNLIVDQYVDTRDTLSDVYNLLNEGFSDPAPQKSTLRPRTGTAKASEEDQSGSSEMSTTTEPYRISRYELGRILGRNFRGLQRLTKIELQDAFNQSHYNIQEYKDEARKQFANSVGVEKVDQIKQLKATLNG